MDNLPVGRALLGTSIGQRSYFHLLARIPTANVALRSTVSSAPHHSSVVTRSLSELVLGRIAVDPNNHVIELPRGRWLSSELLTQTKVHLLEQRRRDAVIPRCGNCRFVGLRPTVSALGTLVCSVLHRYVPVHVDAELLADSGPAQALISIDSRAYRRCQTQRSHNTPHR